MKKHAGKLIELDKRNEEKRTLNIICQYPGTHICVTRINMLSEVEFSVQHQKAKYTTGLQIITAGIRQ